MSNQEYPSKPSFKRERKLTSFKKLRLDEEVVVFRAEDTGLVQEDGKVLSFSGSEEKPNGVTILKRNGRMINIRE